MGGKVQLITDEKLPATAIGPRSNTASTVEMDENIIRRFNYKMLYESKYPMK